MNHLLSALFHSSVGSSPLDKAAAITSSRQSRTLSRSSNNNINHNDDDDEYLHRDNNFIDYSVASNYASNSNSISNSINNTKDKSHGIVITETSFLKNVISVPSSPKSSRRQSRRQSISSNSSLPSIPEADMIDSIPDDIHKVTIISMIDLVHSLSPSFSPVSSMSSTTSSSSSTSTTTSSSSNGEPVDSEFDDKTIHITSDINTVGERLHQIIMSNMNFTCMSNIPAILKSAYRRVSNELRMKSSSDITLPTRLSAITILISGRDVCVAHVGDSRSVIYGLDGNLLQLTHDHIAPGSSEVLRALGDFDATPDTMYFQIQSEPRSSTNNNDSQAPSSEHSSGNNDDNNNNGIDKNKSGSFAMDFLSKISPRRRSKSDNRAESSSSSTASHAPYLVIGNMNMWKSVTNKQIATSIRKNIVDKNLSLDETASKLLSSSSQGHPQKAVLIRWKN